MWIPEISFITCDDYELSSFELSRETKILSNEICNKFEQRSEHDGKNEDDSITLGPGQFLQGTGWRIRHPSELGFFRRTLAPWMKESLSGYKKVPKNDRESHDHEERLGDYPPLPTIQLTTRDVTRWNMAWRSFCAMKQIRGRNHAWRSRQYYTYSFSRRCKDRPYVDDFNVLLLILSFSAAGLIYGGLHALAWSAHFESPTERWLWRVSACVVMGGLPVICFFGWVANKDWKRSYEDTIAFLFLSLTTLIYILARGYLVVECFINLFNLPAGVYEVPSWSAYFPHIS